MSIFSFFSSQTEPLLLAEDAVLVDVRSPVEFNQGHAKGALNWPLDQLQPILSAKKPDPSKPYVIYCASGARAGVAKTLMSRAGFSNVVNVGGIAALAHLGIE